jgi:hypothetical protein
MSLKVLDPHSSKTSNASSEDLWTSNSHWKKNFYLGMLVWTRCDTARLHLVDPICTPAHCRKFGGAGCYYKTSVNGRDIDGIRLSTNRWISLLEAKATSKKPITAYFCPAWIDLLSRRLAGDVSLLFYHAL